MASTAVIVKLPSPDTKLGSIELKIELAILPHPLEVGALDLVSVIPQERAGTGFGFRRPQQANRAA